MSDKTKLELSKDFFSLTMMCFLIENYDKFLLNKEKISQLLLSAIWVSLVQYVMMWCMLVSILENENGDYGNELDHSFALFFVKLLCTIALHFGLHPEVHKGL